MEITGSEAGRLEFWTSWRVRALVLASRLYNIYDLGQKGSTFWLWARVLIALYLGSLWKSPWGKKGTERLLPQSVISSGNERVTRRSWGVKTHFRFVPLWLLTQSLDTEGPPGQSARQGDWGEVDPCGSRDSSQFLVSWTLVPPSVQQTWTASFFCLSVLRVNGVQLCVCNCTSVSVEPESLPHGFQNLLDPLALDLSRNRCLSSHCGSVG